MDQQSHPDMHLLSREEGALHSDGNKTVVLTDLSDINPRPSEAPAQGVLEAAHLSSTALAALSQRYDILAEAGHGSMGNVYKARDRETGETVALKLLKPEIASDQGMVDRFKNELLFARKITHKNVCRVYEFNRIGGIAYTSMEFVEGESLRSVLNRFGGLPIRKATDLIIQICSGLREAHAQGIVHRDLKPENVMIDGQGGVKIMDFGIARSMEAATRLTGSMVGTPAYMAPEQVAGKSIDYRTDIYSLGLIMYELFTGKQAFNADNAVAIALKQMRESPAPPHEIEPTLPVSIERTILKCLEKEPAKRFQSIAELEQAMKVPSGPITSAVASGAAFNNQVAHVSPGASASMSRTAPSSSSKKKPTIGVFVWILVAALMAVAAMAGWHWGKVAQAADRVTPPSWPTPAPPRFALDPATLQIPAAPAPADSAKTDAAAPAPPRKQVSVANPKDDSSGSDSRASSSGPQTQDSAQPVEEKPVAPAVQQRANQAFEGNRSASAPATGEYRGVHFLWVGRYQREDRAQAAAKKVEDLHLPVAVFPKQTPQGQFYVVISGPISSGKIQGVIDSLQSGGFSNVRPLKNALGNQGQGGNRNSLQSPSEDSDENP